MSMGYTPGTAPTVTGQQIKDTLGWCWSKYEKIFPGKYNVVFGNSVTSAFALPGATIASASFGSNLKLVADFMGSFKGWMGTEPAFSWGGIVMDILMGLGGNSELILGRNNKICYGVKRDFHRGPSLSLNSKKVTDASILCQVLAVLTCATNMTSTIMADLDPEVAGQAKMNTFGLIGVSKRLLAILMDLETKVAALAQAESKAKEAERQAQAAESFAALAKLGMVESAADNVEQAAGYAANVAGAPVSADPDVAQTIRGAFNLSAQSISLIGQKEDTTLGPSNINIDAQGHGDAMEDGTLTLNATNETTIKVGPASIQVARLGPLGGIMIDTGDAAGEVTVKCGPPVLGTQIKMTPLSLQLSSGDPAIQSCISLTPEGITLKFAEWTINLGPTGIAMQVAENSWALTPAGMTANVLSSEETIETAGNEDAPMIEIVADGEVSIAGSIVMVN